MNDTQVSNKTQRAHKHLEQAFKLYNELSNAYVDLYLVDIDHMATLTRDLAKQGKAIAATAQLAKDNPPAEYIFTCPHCYAEWVQQDDQDSTCPDCNPAD